LTEKFIGGGGGGEKKKQKKEQKKTLLTEKRPKNRKKTPKNSNFKPLSTIFVSRIKVFLPALRSNASVENNYFPKPMVIFLRAVHKGRPHKIGKN